VLVRPGAYVFLKKVCASYEVVIFTASTKKYANKVIDSIDPDKIIPHRLFRKHCTLVNCEFVKDLSQLGRDLKDVIIIDNSPDCFSLQPCNGIPILTWINDKNDKELDRLSSILDMLHDVNDVRDYLREVVRDNELDYLQALKLLKGEITLDEVQRNPSAYWSSPRKKKLSSPERSRSQFKYHETAGKHKNQKKSSLGMKFATKIVQNESPDMKHEDNFYAVLPKTIDETPKKPLNKPPINPTSTENKPIIKLKLGKPPGTPDIQLRKNYSVMGDSSCSKFTSAEKVPYKPEYKPNNELPPRPSYKGLVLRALPLKVERGSTEASKQTSRVSYSQNGNKASNLSYDSKSLIKEKVHRPPAYPAYGKYIGVSQPPCESNSIHKSSRSYSTSMSDSNDNTSIKSEPKRYGVFSYKRYSIGNYK